MSGVGREILNGVRTLWRGTRSNRLVSSFAASWFTTTEGDQKPLGEILDALAPLVRASVSSPDASSIVFDYFGLDRYPMDLKSGQRSIVGRIYQRNGRPLSRSGAVKLRTKAIEQLNEALGQVERRSWDHELSDELDPIESEWWAQSPAGRLLARGDERIVTAVGARAIMLLSPIQDSHLPSAVARWRAHHQSGSDIAIVGGRLTPETKSRSAAAIGLAAWQLKTIAVIPELPLGAVLREPNPPARIVIAGHPSIGRLVSSSVTPLDVDQACEAVARYEDADLHVADVLLSAIDRLRSRVAHDRTKRWLWCLTRGLAAHGDIRAVATTAALLDMGVATTDDLTPLTWAAHAAAENAQFDLARSLVATHTRRVRRTDTHAKNDPGIRRIELAWQGHLLSAGIAQREIVVRVRNQEHDEAEQVAADAAHHAEQCLATFHRLPGGWRVSDGLEADDFYGGNCGPSDYIATLHRFADVLASSAFASAGSGRSTEQSAQREGAKIRTLLNGVELLAGPDSELGRQRRRVALNTLEVVEGSHSDLSTHFEK